MEEPAGVPLPGHNCGRVPEPCG